jgi:ketosteroid isomerase-like protein
MDAPPRRPEDVVRLMFDARQQGEDELLLALMDPDVVASTRDGGTYRGREAVRDFLSAERSGGTRVEVTLGHLSVSGEDVHVEGRIRRVQHGRLTDQPASWDFSVRDGLVRRIARG